MVILPLSTKLNVRIISDLLVAARAGLDRSWTPACTWWCTSTTSWPPVDPACRSTSGGRGEELLLMMIIMMMMMIIMMTGIGCGGEGGYPGYPWVNSDLATHRQWVLDTMASLGHWYIRNIYDRNVSLIDNMIQTTPKLLLIRISLLGVSFSLTKTL